MNDLFPTINKFKESLQFTQLQISKKKTKKQKTLLFSRYIPF